MLITSRWHSLRNKNDHGGSSVSRSMDLFLTIFQSYVTQNLRYPKHTDIRYHEGVFDTSTLQHSPGLNIFKN